MFTKLRNKYLIASMASMRRYKSVLKQTSPFKRQDRVLTEMTQLYSRSLAGSLQNSIQSHDSLDKKLVQQTYMSHQRKSGGMRETSTYENNSKSKSDDYSVDMMLGKAQTMESSYCNKTTFSFENQGLLTHANRAKTGGSDMTGLAGSNQNSILSEQEF